MVNKESYFASLHILMRAILMAQRTPAAGFTDTGIEKAAAKSTPAGKNKISVNPVILSNFSSCLRALRGEKIREISVNPWLINDLRLCKTLYSCRDKITDVMGSLQIHLFMQNEPNFRKSQVNVNKVLTKDYEIMDTWWSGKNEPKTNPIKPNFQNAQMNVTSIITNDYEDKPPIWAPKKQSQFSRRQKSMQTFLSQRIMKKTRFRAPTKQTQTNPIQSQNKANANPLHRSPAPAEDGFHRNIASGEAGFHRVVAFGEDGTKPASKRTKITCFRSNYSYNCWFGINIGDFLCVNNAAVVVLMQKPPSKTR